jgi:hypothetical protein
LEHIVPISRGGFSDIENLAWACPGVTFANRTASIRLIR